MNPYHICRKIWKNPFYYLLMCLSTVGGMPNSVDPDQTPLNAASDLGVHYLLGMSVNT